MRVTTWNVNSVRARLPRLLPWLEEHRPDVVCLQETKVRDEDFPLEPLEDQGYNVEIFGQKNYNGVALLSRHPIEAVVRGFPDDDADADKRVIGGIVGGFVILNLYVPNGSAVGHPKYDYKLRWFERLRRFLDERYDAGSKLIVTGDFNVTFDDRDVYDPEAWREKILCSTRERNALRQVLAFGLVDGLRKHHEEAGIYTWWDFRTAGFKRNQGLRIDHVLLTPTALQACTDVAVDIAARDGTGASDHAPVTAHFDS